FFMPVNTSNVRMNHGIARFGDGPRVYVGGRRAAISATLSRIVEKGRQDPRAGRACPHPRRYTPPRFGNPSLPCTEAFLRTAGRSFHNCGKSLWTMTLPLAEQSPEAPA